MVIYKVTNIINGKMYIGQTRRGLTKRRNQHIRDAKYSRDTCRKFHKAIRKYNQENFIWDIIFETDDIEVLNEMEIYYISFYDSIEKGYNLVSGGVSYIRTSGFKKRMSELMKDQYRNGRIPNMRGKTHTEETKRKISKNHANVFSDKNPNFGKKERLWLDGENNPSKRPEVKEKQQKAAKKRLRDSLGRFIGKEFEYGHLQT